MPYEVDDKKSQKDVDRIIRDWAHGAGVQVSNRGALPQRVKQAWIAAHRGRNNIVIGHDLFKIRTGSSKGRWDRGIQVLCYHCASVHLHGGYIGDRQPTDESHRVAHCAGGKGPSAGYYIEDELEITENEKAMVAANAAH